LQLDGLSAEAPEFLDNGTAKFDLALELEASTGKACFFEYCTDLFKEETILKMERDFQGLLRRLIAEPAVPLSGIKAAAAITPPRAPSQGGVAEEQFSSPREG
jgi:non-ribosomal peptide synthetase component F